MKLNCKATHIRQRVSSLHTTNWTIYLNYWSSDQNQHLDLHLDLTFFSHHVPTSINELQIHKTSSTPLNLEDSSSTFKHRSFIFTIGSAKHLRRFCKPVRHEFSTVNHRSYAMCNLVSFSMSPGEATMLKLPFHNIYISNNTPNLFFDCSSPACLY